jgi:hypothetical protein
MNSPRKYVMETVENLVRNFSADDVKDWLAEACTVLAGEHRRAGNAADAANYMGVANDIAAVRNRGV